MKRSERRFQIADAVLRIIGERGLTSLSTSTIAEEVGLTTGALYRHFESIDEILVSAALYGVEQLEATFPDPKLPPLERIVVLARNRIDLLHSRPGINWLLRSEQAFLTLPPNATGPLHDVAVKSRKYFLAAVREGVRDGYIRDDIEPETLVVTVMGTVHAMIGNQDRAQMDRVFDALPKLLASPRPSRTLVTRKDRPTKS